MDIKKINLVWMQTLIIFLILSCCSRLSLATEFSIDSVFFKEKKPSQTDDIKSSLFKYDVSIAALKNDVGAINSFVTKGYSVRVVGFTDNQECSGLECKTLSLRRAELIYRWMLENGVPKNRLLSPEGRGSGEPVADNAIPEGRARNRTVGFELVPNSP